jgi:dTDP-4-dehydrorhamnose 3,5-epimerase
VGWQIYRANSRGRGVGMKFLETKLKGAYVIEIEPISDNRGFFARSWCQQEFRDRGLNPNLVQCNISFNTNKGTLRGMHYQAKPHEEAKLVRCTRGSIYDVIIDIRPDSSTFKSWLSIELSAENRKALYIPEGFAHGFQTLENNTEVFYQMSDFYHPESAKGIRWNDPTLAVDWLLRNDLIVSIKDQQYPLFETISTSGEQMSPNS